MRGRRFGDPLPFGVVTVANHIRSQDYGVRLRILMDEDGVVRAYLPELQDLHVVLSPGDELILDVGVIPLQGAAVPIQTKTYIVRKE